MVSVVFSQKTEKRRVRAVKTRYQDPKKAFYSAQTQYAREHFLARADSGRIFKCAKIMFHRQVGRIRSEKETLEEEP